MEVYFDQLHEYTDINGARLNSFFKSVDPNLRSIILSESALLQHTKRSAFQAGWVWRDCLHNLKLPSPTTWGWKMTSDLLLRFYPLWRRKNYHSVVEDTIVTCSYMCQL